MNDETREAWLAERKRGIGGSDAAAILGISPWRTAVDVWLDKTGRAEPQPETEAMRIGTELEDFVARRYAMETGREVRRHNAMIHEGCLLGNVDRLVVPEGAKVAAHQGEVRTDTILECKTSSRDWEDGVPLYYQTQVQHYMGLLPMVAHADVACLFLVHKAFRTFRVERDDEVIRIMKDRLTAWWERHVVRDEMPEARCEEDAKKLWARSNPGKTIVAVPSVIEALEAYKAAKARADEADEAVKAARDVITGFLGDGEILADPTDGKPLATWKSAKDARKTDWKAVAEHLEASPELIEEHTRAVAGVRRLLVK